MLKYPKLFSSFRLGNHVLKNRIVMPAMDTSLCNTDGSVSTDMIRYYEKRARGGVGMIIIEYTAIDHPYGRGSASQVKINDVHVIPGFQNITNAMHAYNTKVLLQLHHAGMRAYPMPGVLPVGPSEDAGKVHGMTIDEIAEMTKKYVVAAKNAQKAGMDGVEIHAGHGYLVNQFLSPATNFRTDEYGGSNAGRTKFLIDIIREVRKACGKNFIISVRLAAKDWDPNSGLTLEDGVEIAQLIDKEGIDLINITAGLKYKHLGGSETQEWPDGNRLDLARAIKPHVKTPVSIVGKIRAAEMCEEILEEGIADLVVMGRPLISDPNWPNKVRLGKEETVRQCLNCMEGCYAAIGAMRGVRCAINPYCGFEAAYDEDNLPLSPNPHRVVVVGGGITGMQAAITASERGHRVILLEKTNMLGGQMDTASIPPHKETLKTALEYFKKQLIAKSVEVHLEFDAAPDKIVKFKPDTVIIATGSTPTVPPIEGMELTFDSHSVLRAEKKPTDKKITIIGGGTVGCETALYLLDGNNQITIIEMLDSISNGQESSHKARDIEILKNNEVAIHTLSAVQKVDKNVVTYKNVEGYTCYEEADIVITATGLRPNGAKLYDALSDAGIRVEMAGDAAAIGNIRTNVLSGFRVGYDA